MYKPNPVAGILAIILLASLIFGGPILFFIVACILAVINLICFFTHSSSKNKVSKQELDELIRQRNTWLKKEWPKIRENLHKNKINTPDTKESSSQQNKCQKNQQFLSNYQKKYDEEFKKRQKEKKPIDVQNHIETDINQLLTDAKNNIAAANIKYKGKNVKITGGILQSIDPGIKYIYIGSVERSLYIHKVYCVIDTFDKSLTDEILKLIIGQKIIVYGEIYEVGDQIGYRLILHKIEAA